MEVCCQTHDVSSFHKLQPWLPNADVRDVGDVTDDVTNDP